MQLSTTARNRSGFSGSLLQVAVAALAILLAISTVALVQLSGTQLLSLQAVAALVVALAGAVALNSDASPIHQPRG